jgi:phage tail-like protein
MSIDRGKWMLAALPAVYTDRDEASGGTLTRLLEVLGILFFDGENGSEPGVPRLPGLERQIRAIPGLFLPLAQTSGSGHADPSQTPERFLHWLATWLAFAPHGYLEPPALRRVLANIVPLYGLRGTRKYLNDVLKLSFDEWLDESGTEIDDRPRTGFLIGTAYLGRDTRLVKSRPFFSIVALRLRPGVKLTSGIERRLRAVIDFAKPAHVSYDLRIQASEPNPETLLE